MSLVFGLLSFDRFFLKLRNDLFKTELTLPM